MYNHQLRPLPAGLIDNDIEFFNDPKDTEKCYVLTSGSVTRVSQCLSTIKEMIRDDLSKHPVKAEALVLLGYESDDEQLEKYCSCCFGAFDGLADVVNGVFRHNEYVPCPHRGSCPVEGKLCNALKVGNGDALLTRSEIQILCLIAKGLLDKEIADRLNISCETVKVHKRHLMEKSGCMNKPELILLANLKNLL